MKYEKPKMELVDLALEDVICASKEDFGDNDNWVEI